MYRMEFTANNTAFYTSKLLEESIFNSPHKRIVLKCRAYVLSLPDAMGVITWQ